MLCIVSKYHLQDRTKNKQTNKKRPVMLYHTTRCRLLFVLLRLSASTVVSCSKTNNKNHKFTHGVLTYLFVFKVNGVTWGHARSRLGAPEPIFGSDPLICGTAWSFCRASRNSLQIELTGTDPPINWPTNWPINQPIDRLVDWLIDSYPNAFVSFDFMFLAK